jgi:2,4-dienoyl-CoA reductase-like NADH-dependent reductase (Old Yellow Enzyme family)
LSLTTNQRTDEYGGDLDNRSRVVFEIIDEIRRRVVDPKFTVCVKINSVEFQDKGTYVFAQVSREEGKEKGKAGSEE